MELVGNCGHHGVGHYHLKNVYLDVYLLGYWVSLRQVCSFLPPFLHLISSFVFFSVAAGDPWNLAWQGKLQLMMRCEDLMNQILFLVFWGMFLYIRHFDHIWWQLLILKQLDVATCGLWFWFMTPHDFWVVTVLPSCRISESRIMSLFLASWMYGRLLRLLTEVIFFMKQLKPPASLVSRFLDFQQFYIKLGAAFLFVYLIDHKQTVWFSQGRDLVIYHIPFPPWRTQPRGTARCKRCHLLRCFGEKGGDT